MGALAFFPQAPVKLDGLTPETVAKQLFPMTGIAKRAARASREDVEARRRAYIAGVAALRAAQARAYWDPAERLRIPGPNPATSYGEPETLAYAWGWDDAAVGRFADVTRAPESEYSGPVSGDRPGRRAGTSRGCA